MKTGIFCIVVIMILSCENLDQKKSRGTVVVENNNDSFKTTPKILKKDEQSINNKVFISIIPSQDHIDSMQKLNGEDGWDEVVMDNEYYIGQTETFLKSKGYKEVYRLEEKLWKLSGDNGLIKYVDSDTLLDKWGLIIFDGHNDPFYYNGIVPEQELKDL